MKQIILLTGGSAGIGKSTAEILAQKGCIVYAGSRKPQSVEQISGTGKIIPVQMDVNDEASVQAVVNQILNENGKLDTVICNAGFGIAGSIEDSGVEEAKSQFETNYFGVIKTIQACLPHFRAQKAGKIITVSSVAGIIPIPYQGHYSAVKAASLMMMKALAMEVKPWNIQCCSVLPGDTKTNFTAARIYVQNANEKSDYYQKMNVAVGKMEKDEQNGMPAMAVASEIACQAMSKKMKTIVIPGLQYKIFSWLGNMLPAKWIIGIVGKMY